MKPFAYCALAALVAGTASAEEPPVAPPEARAEIKPPPVAIASVKSAWELDAFIGYGQLAFPTTDTATVTSSSGGPAFSLDVAYRGPHFTHPFFDLSYVPILSSSKYVNVAPSGGAGTTVQANNSTYALGGSIGPGWDIDWFRLRTGVGIYDVVVQTNVNGQASKISAVEIGFLVTASAMVWRPEPFALGLEARLVALQSPTAGIFQSMWEIGLTGRWDFVHHP